MEQDDNNKKFTEFNKKKHKIKDLRNQLNKINEEKEKWFSTKNLLHNKISDLIKVLKESKTCRDSLSADVKVKKEDRNNINVQIKKKIDEIKKINQTGDNNNHDRKNNPAQIKYEIKKLEEKFETEAMKFPQEKKIMQTIKELKKKYEETKNVNLTQNDNRQLSNEIDELKKKSDLLHKEIQSKAKESQIKHETLINASEQIRKLNTEEKEAFGKFIELKKNFGEINNSLKKELNDLNSLQSQISEIKQTKIEGQSNAQKKRLRDLEKDVEEKIKTGKKLTTEDLLIIQENLS